MKNDTSLRIAVVGILVVCVVTFGIYSVFSKPKIIKLDTLQLQKKATVVTHASGLIYASVPQAGTEVNKEVTVLGMAKGPWFFEGSFPVSVVDAEGKVVGEGVAEAQGEWMTEGYVPYKATIQIKGVPQTKDGAIVLVREDPSGEKNESFLTIPVKFKGK